MVPSQGDDSVANPFDGVLRKTWEAILGAYLLEA